VIANVSAKYYAGTVTKPTLETQTELLEFRLPVISGDAE